MIIQIVIKKGMLRNGRFFFRKYFEQKSVRVNEWLDRLLPAESETPSEIHKAMRYSTMAGGKRLRPILTIATGEACGLTGTDAESKLMPAACALEMIHTYSLIHDDLPAMDNDDLRRGRPTCHRIFGDGIAVLAGDALLTIAFEIATQAKGWPRYDLREVFREIAIAAGSRRLIAGQVADLEGEGKKINRSQLRYIHENKTSALLTTSIRLGAMSANATPTQLKAVSLPILIKTQPK